jgi:hypothetical protein
VTAKLKSETPEERVCRIKAAYIERTVAFAKVNHLAGSPGFDVRDLTGTGVLQRLFKPGERVFPLSHRAPVLLVVQRGAIDIFVRCDSSHRRLAKRVTDGRPY